MPGTFGILAVKDVQVQNRKKSPKSPLSHIRCCHGCVNLARPRCPHVCPSPGLGVAMKVCVCDRSARPAGCGLMQPGGGCGTAAASLTIGPQLRGIGGPPGRQSPTGQSPQPTTMWGSACKWMSPIDKMGGGNLSILLVCLANTMLVLTRSSGCLWCMYQVRILRFSLKYWQPLLQNYFPF